MTQNSRKYWLLLRIFLIRKGTGSLFARECLSPITGVKYC